MQLHELACSSFLRLSSSQEFRSACSLSSQNLLHRTNRAWNTSSYYILIYYLPAHEKCFILMMFPFQLFYSLPLLFLTDNFFLQQSREWIKGRMLHMLSPTGSTDMLLVSILLLLENIFSRNLPQISCNIVFICSHCGHSPPGKELYEVCRPGGGACLGCPAVE